MSMHTLVLFDIDGTLLSSSSAGRSALRRAFAEQYDDLDFFDQIRFDGKTDRQIVRELHHAAGRPERATDVGTMRVLDRYLTHLPEELSARTDRVLALPGVFDLLSALEEQNGICLGLLTGNVVPGARLKLGAAGIDFERFRLGAYGSDSEHRPELPPIAAARAAELFGRTPHGDEIVIIGDTPADVTCGECISARTIAVATGSYTREELDLAGADHSFDTLEETDRLLEAILCSNLN